ncbi:hypothetical protein [Deinococcus sp. QL22]|uniref:hypothetical protein n=1 Tax=Deinococcus sp. QL22 TaxID=2939437 RepID=UPI002016A8C1|nr:hypothetical protein [Deinococcus sp. QL22]UQN07580.1 hypothetical protein M1R55_06770 [Deinococcus sp. QL22]
MNEQHQPEDFRSQVQRLVAEGKLTPDEAAGLLEGDSPTEASTEPMALMPTQSAAEFSETPPDLDLYVSGYSLTVLHDTHLSAPQLSANRDGEVTLQATANGWIVRRLTHSGHHTFSLKAILALPFAPRNVHVQVEGGSLTLPDVSGEMQAEVNGGHVRMGRAASLNAEVNGGNLTATELGGPTHLNVNGGNLTLEGARSLNASINGGNLRWAGVLTGGNHRLEVNAGNATVYLKEGSNVTLRAEVTVGAFKSDFATSQSGGFLNTRHGGQLGSGEAQLSCRVTAGQVKVLSGSGVGS